MRSLRRFTAFKLACAFTAAALLSGVAGAAPKPKLSLSPQVGERGGTPPTRTVLIVMENGQRIRMMKWVCVGCSAIQGPGHPSDGMSNQGGTAASSSSGPASMSPN